MMSAIKSFSVGNGDMFYIHHNSDNFTIIDCCLDDENKEVILDEIVSKKRSKGITRFISTHPDEDHIRGLEILDEKIRIVNFYCVENKATKDDETDSFRRYCELRDDAKKAFYISNGCSRRWMNRGDEARKSSGVNVLWPKLENQHFKEELDKAEEGESPNNISPIISYTYNENVIALWMGDLETEFMEKIEDEVDFEEVAVLFAPHHGRDSGKIPESILEKLKPKIIVIGEAPSEHLNYYPGYNTITQNSAGDIVFDIDEDGVHVFTSNEYEADFLEDKSWSLKGYFYAGSLILDK